LKQADEHLADRANIVETLRKPSTGLKPVLRLTG